MHSDCNLYLLRLGVATFLILEKQQGLEGRMRESAKAAAAEQGGAPRLIDLIKPAEPRLAVAFYYGRGQLYKLETRVTRRGCCVYKLETRVTGRGFCV